MVRFEQIAVVETPATVKEPLTGQSKGAIEIGDTLIGWKEEEKPFSRMAA